MKNIKYTYLSLGLALLVAACGQPDKKAELEKLKSEQASLSEKIKALEDEIKKTDTTTASVSKFIIVGFEEIRNNLLYIIFRFRARLIQIKMYRSVLLSEGL